MKKSIVGRHTGLILIDKDPHAQNLLYRLYTLLVSRPEPWGLKPRRACTPEPVLRDKRSHTQ